MLKEAETSKSQERTNTDPETPKSLRANPSALPVEGSMARVLLQVEAEENMKAEAIRRERERKIKEAERVERQADRVFGGFSPAKPFILQRDLQRKHGKRCGKNGKRGKSRNRRENLGDREPKSVDFGCFGLALCRLNARIFHP